MKIDHVPYARLKTRSETFQNPRTQSGLEEAEIRELAISIGWQGLIYPLRVTPDDVIRGGQRRYLAIGYLAEHIEDIADHLACSWGGDMHGIRAVLTGRVESLLAAVPVIVETDHDTSMADNLTRVDLSSYEIAAEIARRSAHGDTGAEIALKIGRSPSYVSKALKAWRGAGDALKAAWRDGSVSYDQVKQLADLQEEEQERAIAGPKPRGGHGRPGIEAVKGAVGEISRHYEARAADRSYAMGVLDALRWVTGETSSVAFAEFMGAIES